MKITIYGAGDDLIEIEGDFKEEFGVNARDVEENGGVILGISDGTLLHVTYGANRQALWRITPLAIGSAAYEKKEATNEKDNYSDRVTLTLAPPAEFHWIVLGGEWRNMPK
jgi:hypothetical protein